MLVFRSETRLVNVVIKDIVIGAGGLGFGSLAVSHTVSLTTRHRCDVFSKLCRQSVEPRKWARYMLRQNNASIYERLGFLCLFSPFGKEAQCQKDTILKIVTH